MVGKNSLFVPPKIHPEQMSESFNHRIINDERAEFLQESNRTRCKRVEWKQKNDAIVRIQSFYRTCRAKRMAKEIATERFEKLMQDFNPEEEKFVNAAKVFEVSSPIIRRYQVKLGVENMEKLCRYINWSKLQTDPIYSYISCGFSKDTCKNWIRHVKEVAINCLYNIRRLKPELVSESKLLSVLLATVVSILSLDKWSILGQPSYTGLSQGMKNLTVSLLAELRTKGFLFHCFRDVLIASLTRPDKFYLTKPTLSAIVTLATRAVNEDTKRDQSTLAYYIFELLSVPGYIYYVHSLCPDGIPLTWVPSILRHISYELNNVGFVPLAPQDFVDVPMHGVMDLTRKLSMLGNLVQLGQLCATLKGGLHPEFNSCINKLVHECGKHTNCKKKINWHPFLGWLDQPVPTILLNCNAVIKQQMEYLWGPTYVATIFYRVFRDLDKVAGFENREREETQREIQARAMQKPGALKSAVNKVLRKFSLTSRPPQPHHRKYQTLCSIDYKDDHIVQLASACDVYFNVINTFSSCKLEILTGLCFKSNPKFPHYLWSYIFRLDAWKLVGDYILKYPKTIIESLICLFAESMTHFVTMLDDQEMYEDQKIFTLDELILISRFSNHIYFDIITHEQHTVLREPTKTILKTFYTVMYRRDCRRPFCPEKHWLIGSAQTHQNLVTDILRGYDHFRVGKHNVPDGIEKKRRILYDMPHTIRDEYRIILFRKWITNDKARYGIGTNEQDFNNGNSTLITIQRGRIVEDGYNQLSILSTNALKGTIRVRFQNELGLDEAGIDQDGVFKEFLEETISAVFNPTLNLFRTTNENLLYPSHLSYLHDNHLNLFEFVGKMLGKAIYEGTVVDVHFAPFFLSQILGFQSNTLFSAIDEVQSLDRELYNSLNYLKHYDGNVEDMELTFSVNQECLGEVQTIELMPGGKSMVVTNQNKISYLHLKAHFHLHTQIKDQTAAFLKGFRSIIAKDWIEVFSPIELQRLISGEDNDMDLDDLRKHTQYYGGFHDSHRVVVWLWDILQNEFNETERRKFLKFVTSCSKPPLMGFSNLDPQFSIRCVEVSDDEDTGDTIGSVLRGFLTIGKKDPVGRLPTSSTCFNLLKLPNYQKKTTLRDKLRYAVTANTGFELS